MIRKLILAAAFALGAILASQASAEVTGAKLVQDVQARRLTANEASMYVIGVISGGYALDQSGAICAYTGDTDPMKLVGALLVYIFRDPALRSAPASVAVLTAYVNVYCADKRQL